MRIVEALDTGYPVFSFEFFPPKSDEAEQKLWSTLRDLRDLKPTFVSVTYGAGGSTRTKTVDLTRKIKAELGIEPMAHLTCVGSDRDELRGVLSELQAGGVENVLPLRGDPPKGQDSFEAVDGGFSYASDLTSFIKQDFDFCLGGACYPEGHLECASPYQDLHNLKRKVDAGAEFLVTQLFFDNRLYFDFVDRARAAGITVPIIAGLMPVTNVEQIKRFTKMCGASLPEPFLHELEKRADQPERVMELGIAHATIQALGLIQGGAPGIHFYTLNKSTATREILTAIRMQARV
jgi:methylenetetrahydrofolate reductase (NADPH)